MKKVFLFVISLSISNCKGQELYSNKSIFLGEYNDKNEHVSAPIATTTTKQDVTKRIKFPLIRALFISELTKSNQYPSSLKDTTICNNWAFNAESAKKVFGLSKEINLSEWDYAYDHLPCQYIGTITSEGNTYPIHFNAGSWFSIFYLNRTIRYGCADKRCDKYFLSSSIDE